MKYKKSRSAIVLAALTFLLSACTVLGIDSTEGELKDQQKRWQALNLNDYTFEFQRSCFCGGPHGFLRVTVASDRIVAVVDSETGQPPQNLFPGWVGTVDEIFQELIEDARDAHKVEVSFNDDLHYPTRASVDRIKHAIDDEYSLTLRNLRAAR